MIFGTASQKKPCREPARLFFPARSRNRQQLIYPRQETALPTMSCRNPFGPYRCSSRLSSIKRRVQFFSLVIVHAHREILLFLATLQRLVFHVFFAICLLLPQCGRLNVSRQAGLGQTRLHMCNVLNRGQMSAVRFTAIVTRGKSGGGQLCGNTDRNGSNHMPHKKISLKVKARGITDTQDQDRQEAASHPYPKDYRAMN